MTRNSSSRLFVAMAVVWMSASAFASQYNVIYRFPGGANGNLPLHLVSDSAGNLYGTTEFGGVSQGDGWGVVFKLTPGSGGSWTETVLYKFTGGTDGGQPVAGVTMDAAGNLYGTTSAGGDPTCTGLGGFCGVVYELSNSGGTWSEKVLHSFTGPDGVDPQSGVTFDQAGNLYGTTANGGPGGYGVVYQLSPNGDGTWTEKIIRSFGSHNKAGGSNPGATPVFDASGNLYSTTSSGGDLSCGSGLGCGTLFQLAPQSDGTWSSRILVRFNGTDGATPVSLSFDASGNLFGAAFGGGGGGCSGFFENGCGTIFELSPRAGGFKGSLPHVFAGSPSAGPVGVVPDAVGNLYGATLFTGTSCTTQCGTLFKLTPATGGGYNFGVLHEFQGGADGFAASDSPILGADGNIYGSTQTGGDLTCGQSVGCGVIYQIVP